MIIYIYVCVFILRLFMSHAVVVDGDHQTRRSMFSPTSRPQISQDRLMNKFGLPHCKVVETAHPYEKLG